ncbi:MAG: hypothetical protein GF315_13665 [candidate division Zixibacteria bacterium]|nr:hypothetical protein [candidate division Zixibacteria bacterium]
MSSNNNKVGHAVFRFRPDRQFSKQGYCERISLDLRNEDKDSCHVMKMLHAYELRLLSEKEQFGFEVHLAVCHECYNEVTDFLSVIRVLKNSKSIPRTIQNQLKDVGERRKMSL